MTYSLHIRDIVEDSTRRTVYIIDGACAHCKAAVSYGEDAFKHECAENKRKLITTTSAATPAPEPPRNVFRTHPGVKGAKA